MIIGTDVIDGVMLFTQAGCGCCEQQVKPESVHRDVLVTSREHAQALITEIDAELNRRTEEYEKGLNETSNPLA